MNKTSDHYPTDRRKTGQVSAYRNEYETDCSDESIMFDSDKTDLEVSRDRRNGVERELKKTKQKSYNERDGSSSFQINYFWLLKDSQFVTSLRQDSTHGLQHVPCFDIISEQDELRFNDESEELNEKVNFKI